MFYGHLLGWNPRDKKNDGIVHKNMAAKKWFNGVFIFGHPDDAATGLAKEVAKLMEIRFLDFRKLLAEETVKQPFEVLEAWLKNGSEEPTEPHPVVVANALTSQHQLNLLELFDRTALFHFNHDGAIPYRTIVNQLEICETVRRTRSVPVISVQNQKTIDHTVKGVLMSLKGLKHPPVQHVIAQQALDKLRSSVQEKIRVSASVSAPKRQELVLA